MALSLGSNHELFSNPDGTDSENVVVSDDGCVVTGYTWSVTSGAAMTMTLGGNSPTLSDQQFLNGHRFYTFAWVGAAKPANGTRALTWSISGAELVVISYTTWVGIDQTTPFDNTNYLAPGASTPDSISVTSRVGDIVLGLIGVSGNPTPAGTQIHEDDIDDWVNVQYVPGQDGTTTLSWSASGTTYQLMGINVRAAAGSSPQSVTPTGIASAEAFGSQTVAPGAVSILPTGIASLEAFGTAALSAVISPSAIASLEAFGAVAVIPGVVYILPNAITSGETFGSPVLSLVQSIVAAGGIVSLEEFGTVVVIVPQAIFVEAIASLEAIGGIERVLRPGWDHVGDPTPAWGKEDAGAGSWSRQASSPPSFSKQSPASPGWAKQGSIDVEWENEP